MKRIMSSLLAVTMIMGTLLTGCAQQGGTQTIGAAEQGTTSEGNGKVVVNFWHSLGSANGERVKELVERFNASQDEVEVIETFQGSYVDTSAKIQQSIAAGTQPAIAMVERAFVEKFALANTLENLKPYMEKSGFSEEEFVEGLMGYSYYDEAKENLVSIPFNRSTPILYYNKDMFKAAGLDPEKAPATWDELYECAKALTKKEGEKVTYGITWPIEPWYFKAMVAQSGGRTINEDKNDVGFVDNGTGVEVLEFWVKLKDEGILKVPPAKDGAQIARQAFYNQEAAMFMESTSLIGGMRQNTEGKFEFGTAYLPANEKFAVPTGGANIAVLAKCSQEQKDAAWKFIEWLMTDPAGGTQFVLDTGYMPFTKTMVESEAIQNLWKEFPQYKVAYDQLEYAVDTEQHAYWSEVKSEIKKNIQAVMHDGKTTPQEAVENMSKEAKIILVQ